MPASIIQCEYLLLKFQINKRVLLIEIMKKFTKQIHNQEGTHLIYYSNSTSFWIESSKPCLIFEIMLFHGEVGGRSRI